MSRLGDQARLLGQVILLGVVTELDVANARVRVDADGLITDWLAWGERRAGSGLRTWSPPQVGEQVVLACPYGDPSQAVILCSVNQDRYPPPASVETVEVAEFGDGTRIEYDRGANRLTVDVGAGNVVVNCATAEIHATDSVMLDSPATHLTGDLNVDGDITTPAEVKAGDIGLKAHHHTAQGATAPTTPAQA